MTEPFPRVITGETVGPVDASMVPRYAGEATFARLPRIDEVPQADVAVLGVPFDSGVSYRPGARFGPSHIRESSRLLRPYNPALQVSPFAAQQVADAGDLAVNPFSIGAPYTHGTPFRRASEEGLLDRTGCLHAGIRGPLYTDADLTQDTDLGFQVISAPDVDQLGVTGMVERIQQRVGDRPVYVSVDIDVLDPAHAPGTGTPEAGGLSSRELLTTLRSFSRLNLVGADIVEVAPAYDHAQITGIAAAHVGYELLSALAARKGAL
jgi:guanidinobutyrase / D-arginase